ncbi:hypothetical protein Asp14428_16900 [Actinoplanes sp. NBRC 14428]|uniref:Methoxymalonate biosynthesis acyl carrier protein n=1 Tax=Pseudosporangium ferrugineum TaxID=439699 RepID=A0A2T0SB74_9ACTN|nr:acyl carrier protein [Pseudosporangium ferrugineum]PRY30670.1 methoxymalonate biosynthesis acyl carrier protein [Pseudosporangium ferrugineum]BCJ50215.1 hypothetical protein Asp14428_16900 [Actinoplanes sp. NBRC 14428]
MTTSTENGRVEKDLAVFLRERTGSDWAADSDLFAEGGLSSLFAMELVVHLENTFGITISGADLQLANFRTIAAMAGLVARLREPAGD